jgi:CheY-like chemotaxis protein
VDLERFVAQHRPRVIVYDIAPPYENNWLLFQHLRSLPALAGLKFIITTTNARQVGHFAKSGEPVHEIVGKPFDLGEIVTAVRDALRARATR